MTDTFQKRFIKAMDLRGMRQIDVADKTGLDKAQISQYKNGKYEPMQDALYKLAKALNVNVAWLMGYDVPMEVDQMDLLQRLENNERIAKCQNNTEFAEILRMIDELNDAGIKRLHIYLSDLVLIDKYTK